MTSALDRARSTPVPFDNNLSHGARRAIATVRDRQLDDLLYRLESERDSISTCADCRETLCEWMHDASILIGLDLDERLRLVEHYADDLDLRLTSTAIGDLRGTIENLATSAVFFAGEAAALNAWQQVENLLDDLGLDLDALVIGNPYEYFRHYAERDHDDWQVYEYRNLEGEGVHVDLFEYHVDSICFCVRQYLERGSLSPEEERWSAT